MTVGELQRLMETRRLRYHFEVIYGVDPGESFDRFAKRLVQVPRRCVEALIMDLPSDVRVCAHLKDRDLVIG